MPYFLYISNIMKKILGIDTGTNSLGWAILERNENEECHLKEHGTNIFQEGVKIEKGIESSKAADRTAHRSLRKHYWRRKIRKIRLLNILVSNHLCPPLNKQDLRNWRTKKIYPQDEFFMNWQRTEDKENVNPYRFRHICLTEKLDLTDITQRYILGRALYHLNQRRGFLSNRKESTKESEGKVKDGISDLSKKMEESGCTYLGEYFFQLYQKGEKIRAHYTDRNAHYKAEFEAICKKQELDKDLVSKLEKAIFFQRPLKSQKQQVGKCTFESKKSRCPVSHPLFEEYRMYSFLNNIKIQDSNDEELRPLSTNEKKEIIPLFFRKSKRTFSFEDIAKKLAGRNNYCHVSDKVEKPYKFNYFMDTTVSGCPVITQLVDIFGENWRDSLCKVYTLAKQKSQLEILNDIWHALFFFDDEEKLQQFGKEKLRLSDEQAKQFSQIKLPQDYASLSLNAIKKILLYLEKYNLIYSEAIFLANLCEVLPRYVWNVEELRESAIAGVINVMHEEHILQDGMTKEQRVKEFLKRHYDVEEDTLKKLYHPSMLETYPRRKPDDEGIYQLGSPRISSVRNPMAMHSLFRLRKVINLLLKERKIDEDTIIHIEFSRDLNDANRRKAIQDYQRKQEKKNEEARERIQEHYDEVGIKREPSDTDILKYQLWEEQSYKCLYTGDEISLSDFLGENPKYDIEHTIPRSVGGDSTKANLTLCQSKFNRETKKAMLPSELSNHLEILERVTFLKKKYEELDKRIRKTKGKSASTKEEKDKNIQQRHGLMLERDYYRGKYERFTMKKVKEGFARRQGVDNSVISRYARQYLKSVFRKVHIVKGIATSDFRKIWGIQEEYTKKERTNHVHHCIDAITIGCISPHEYGLLAHYYHELEEHEKYGKTKPHFPKPWPTFTEDIKHIQDELLIAHYTQDNMPKSAKRRIITPNGKVLAKGDVARGSLHLDTYYGAIQKDGKPKYVVRKDLASLAESDIKKIVDDEVRQKVESAVKEYGNLKKAVDADGVWMNREKNVRIKKVRIFTTLKETIHIRQHRDISKHDYKRCFHVRTENNYMVAIYEGVDAKGKVRREYEEIKVIDAARHYKVSNKNKYPVNDIVPIQKKDYPLIYKLKLGLMVLLYENNAEEVWELDNSEIQKRLYKIIGMSLSDGRMVLLHHQEAGKSTEIEMGNGAFKNGEKFRPKIRVSFNQFNALVDGVDFEINDLGEIKRLIWEKLND